MSGCVSSLAFVLLGRALGPGRRGRRSRPSLPSCRPLTQEGIRMPFRWQGKPLRACWKRSPSGPIHCGRCRKTGCPAAGGPHECGYYELVRQALRIAGQPPSGLSRFSRIANGTVPRTNREDLLRLALGLLFPALSLSPVRLRQSSPGPEFPHGPEVPQACRGGRSAPRADWRLRGYVE